MASGVTQWSAALSEVDGAYDTAALPDTATAIELQAVRVRYKVAASRYRTVLDQLSLRIAEGEFVVVLGQTGCGKSSLLRILLGQEQPEAGSVTVAGRPVHSVDARSAYVPQRYSLFPNRTVLGNLMLGPEMSRYHLFGPFKPGFRKFRQDLRTRALEQLRHLGLSATDAGKYPHQLSGGMQQRVAIAQALMMKPRILLMDEAFSALDPATRGSLQRLLRSLWEETKPTVVFVTHNTAEALFLGTRVIVLARDQHAGDEQGARVALDMTLPKAGLTLARDGQRFLETAEKIERCSQGLSQE